MPGQNATKPDVFTIFSEYQVFGSKVKVKIAILFLTTCKLGENQSIQGQHKQMNLFQIVNTLSWVRT